MRMDYWKTVFSSYNVGLVADMDKMAVTLIAPLFWSSEKLLFIIVFECTCIYLNAIIYHRESRLSVLKNI